MLRQRTRLRPSRVIPTIAIAGVLVAVSATSGATAALVITGNDIKNGTVTTKDIKNEQPDVQGRSRTAR